MPDGAMISPGEDGSQLVKVAGKWVNVVNGEDATLQDDWLCIVMTCSPYWKPEGEKVVRTPCDDCKAERDRLAAGVVSLKADRDKVCEKNADLLDEVRRWRAEAMAGRELLDKHGASLATVWGSPRFAAYASARAANEQVSKSAELTITDNATKPDGGPEALYMAKFKHGGYTRPYDDIALLQKDNPETVGHITLTPGSDGIVRWKWTGKP
jgi:hypothetical protein